MAEWERELEQEKADYDETESKLQLIECDTGALKATYQSQTEMIKSLQSDDEKRVSEYNDATLLRIGIVETLLGLKIADAADSSSRRFDIMFLNLPDDCLNFEESYVPSKSPIMTQQNVKLSSELLDKYRAIHKVVL